MLDKESGHLSDKPVLDVIVELNRGGVTGSLKLERAPLQKAVYFRDGQILFAASNDPKDQLASILVEEGKLGPEQMQVAQARVSPGNPLAKVLTELGYISQRELGDAARLKVEKILTDLFSWKDGTYQFATKSLPKGAIDLDLSTPRLFYNSIGRIQDREWVLNLLDSLETVLTPTSELETFIEASKAEANGAAVLRLPDGVKSIKQIGALASLGEFEVCKILAAGIVAGALEKSSSSVVVATDDAFQVPEASDAEPPADAPALHTMPASPSPFESPSSSGGANTGFGDSDAFSSPTLLEADGASSPPQIDSEAQASQGESGFPSPSGEDATIIEPPPAPPAPEPQAPSPFLNTSTPGTVPLELPVKPPSLPPEDASSSPPDVGASHEEPHDTREGRGLVIDEPEPEAETDSEPYVESPGPRRPTGGRSGTSPVLLVALAAVLVGGLGFAGYTYLWPMIFPPSEGDTAGASQTNQSPAATGGSSANAAGEPAASTATVTTANPSQAQSGTPGGPGASTASPYDNPGSAAASSSPSSTRSPVAPPPPTASAGSQSRPATDTDRPSSTDASSTSTSTSTPTSTPTTTSGGGNGRRLLVSGNLDSAANAFLRELRNERAGTFTIAVGLYCNADNVSRLVRSSAAESELYVLPTTVQGRSCYRVVWGLYDSRQSAEQAMGNLPQSIQAGDAATVDVSRLLR